MSIWSIFPVSDAVHAFNEADRASKLPLETPCVSGIVTSYGTTRAFIKPSGRYGLIDPKSVARNRQNKVEMFKMLLNADAAFDLTMNESFAEEPAAPHSGVRQVTTKTLRGVGT